MSTRLYVGNLAYNTSTEILKQEFGTCGRLVDAKVVTDLETGQSKGFGFIEFSNEAEAARAIQEFNGTSFGGRNIRVSFAEQKTQQPYGAVSNSTEKSYKGGIAPRNYDRQPINAGSYEPEFNDPPKPKKRKGNRKRQREEEMDWG